MLFRISVAFALLVAGCSTPPEKNNDDTVNGDTPTCADNSDCTAEQECVDGDCLDHLTCMDESSEGCPDGQIEAVVNDGEPACYLECDAGACGEGFMCTQGLCIGDGTGGDPDPPGCTVAWTGCSDGKEYDVSCSAGSCTCSVNDVDGNSFDSETDCSGDRFHREVNANCGWLVPAAN